MMQAFIAAVVVGLVVAIGSYYVLDRYQVPADAAYKTDAVRL